jgi:hypothetical protein
MFVELVFFRSKPQVTDADVLASANKILELATKMNSPFELELLRAEDGEWVEIVHWSSQEEAQQVEQAVMQMPEAQEAMSVMEECSVRMVFLHPV